MKAYITYGQFDGLKLYLIGHQDGYKTVLYRQTVSNGVLATDAQEFDLTAPVSSSFMIPNLQVPFYEARGFLESLRDQVDRALKDVTAEPTSVDVLRGELAATKTHLADMRRLVFAEVPDPEKQPRS